MAPELKPGQVWRDQASKKLLLVLQVFEKQHAVEAMWLDHGTKAIYTINSFNFDTYVREFTDLEWELL
jgi:hypothetical protein